MEQKPDEQSDLLNKTQDGWTRKDWILLSFSLLISFGDGVEIYLPGIYRFYRNWSMVNLKTFDRNRYIRVFCEHKAAHCLGLCETFKLITYRCYYTIRGLWNRSRWSSGRTSGLHTLFNNGDVFFCCRSHFDSVRSLVSLL